MQALHNVSVSFGAFTQLLRLSLLSLIRPGLHNSPLWILCFIAATLYQYSWDICVDWALLIPSYSQQQGLRFTARTRKLYPCNWWYTAAALLNLMLRFGWTVTIIPEYHSSSLKQGAGSDEIVSHYLFSKEFQVAVSPFIAAAEILRRGMWGMLRVEAEHLALHRTALHHLDHRDIDGTEQQQHDQHDTNNADIHTTLHSDTEAGIELADRSMNGQHDETGLLNDRHSSSIEPTDPFKDLPFSKMPTATVHSRGHSNIQQQQQSYGETSSNGASRSVSNQIEAALQTQSTAMTQKQARLLPELLCYAAAMAVIGWLASAG